MVHTQPAAGLSDPVLTPRVECVTTCFCLCCGLLRVGWWGHNKGGVGVKEWGCVVTASLCGCRRIRKHFQCFAIILIPHWLLVFIYRKTQKSPHCELNTCKTTEQLFLKVKCTKSENGEHGLVTAVSKHVHFGIHLVIPLWHATNSCEKQTCRQRVPLCPIYNKSVGWMQNSSDTQKQNFRAFYSEGLVHSLLVWLQTKLDLSAEPCSYPTCCLPGMAYVHFL